MKTAPIRISFAYTTWIRLVSSALNHNQHGNQIKKSNHQKGKAILHKIRCVIFLWKCPIIVFSFWKGGACNLSKKRLGCNLSTKPSEWLFIPLPWKFHRLVLGQYTWGVKGICGYLCEVCLTHGTGFACLMLGKNWKHILPNGWFNGDLPGYFGKQSPQKTHIQGKDDNNIPFSYMYVYVYDMICIFFCPMFFLFHWYFTPKTLKKQNWQPLPNTHCMVVLWYIYFHLDGFGGTSR